MRECGEALSVSSAPQTLPGSCRWPVRDSKYTQHGPSNTTDSSIDAGSFTFVGIFSKFSNNTAVDLSHNMYLYVSIHHRVKVINSFCVEHDRLLGTHRHLQHRKQPLILIDKQSDLAFLCMGQ